MGAVAQVKEDLTGWKLGRMITMVDRGFSSANNLRHLQRAGGQYSAGKRMRANIKVVDEVLARPGRYRPVKENLEIKEIIVGDGEARVRYALARNPSEADRDQQKREETLAALPEGLRRLKSFSGEECVKAMCELVASKKFGKYFTLDAKNFGHVLSRGVNCRRDSPRNRGSLVLLGKLVLTVFGAAHGAYEVVRHRPTVSSGGRRRLGATLGAPCRRRRCAACA